MTVVKGLVTLTKEGKNSQHSVSTLLKKTWHEGITQIGTPRMVRIMRRQLNLTQASLATYLGVSEDCVSRWESDGNRHRTIPSDKFLKLKELHQRIFE